VASSNCCCKTTFSRLNEQLLGLNATLIVVLLDVFFTLSVLAVICNFGYNLLVVINEGSRITSQIVKIDCFNQEKRKLINLRSKPVGTVFRRETASRYMSLTAGLTQALFYLKKIDVFSF